MYKWCHWYPVLKCRELLNRGVLNRRDHCILSISHPRPFSRNSIFVTYAKKSLVSEACFKIGAVPVSYVWYIILCSIPQGFKWVLGCGDLNLFLKLPGLEFSWMLKSKLWLNYFRKLQRWWLIVSVMYSVLCICMFILLFTHICFAFGCFKLNCCTTYTRYISICTWHSLWICRLSTASWYPCIESILNVTMVTVSLNVTMVTVNETPGHLLDLAFKFEAQYVAACTYVFTCMFSKNIYSSFFYIYLPVYLSIFMINLNKNHMTNICQQN